MTVPFTKIQFFPGTKEDTIITALSFKRNHTNLLKKFRTIKTVTLYCPEYYIDEINQTTVVRHTLISYRYLIGFKPNRHDKALPFNVFSLKVNLRDICRMVSFCVAVC